MSLVEAMSMGVPIIINDCEYGPKEICEVDTRHIKDDTRHMIDNTLHIFDYGIMCKEGNRESLTEALSLMVTDKNMYNNFNIQKEIQRSKDFSMEKIIQKWLQVL